MSKNPQVTLQEAAAVEVPTDPQKSARPPAWHKLRDVEDVRKAMRQVARDTLDGQRDAGEAQKVMGVLRVLLDGLLDEEAEEVEALHKEVRELRQKCYQYEYQLLRSATAGLPRR
jgi:hypothetical protein